MNIVLTIAYDQWRLWLRSRVAVMCLIIFAALMSLAGMLTAIEMHKAANARAHLQSHANEAFLSQPDRHPHRMVHYGHYAFRVPPPLSLIDPGVDTVTGRSIFLEGHRQNTAMFAEDQASSNMGGFDRLTPAFIFQIFLPLLLIILGHDIIARERAARTLGPLLSQGIDGRQLYFGKGLALLSVAGIMLFPIVFAAILATLQGAAGASAIALTLHYMLYALVWTALISAASVFFKDGNTCLNALVLFWVASALILPQLATGLAGASTPAEGKIQTELRMQADKRNLGDGHDAADPAFAKLKANILAQYDVERVEDLPINFRGVVAQKGEADLTALMRQYSEALMEKEQRQADYANAFGWVSPAIAFGSGSRILVGTDLATHHRFLRETETLRFDFVQGLNKAHIEKLDYIADINRGIDEASSRRARISAENWNVLETFNFQPDTANLRISRSHGNTLMLLIWALVLGFIGNIKAGDLRP